MPAQLDGNVRRPHPMEDTGGVCGDAVLKHPAGRCSVANFPPCGLDRPSRPNVPSAWPPSALRAEADDLSVVLAETDEVGDLVSYSAFLSACLSAHVSLDDHQLRLGAFGGPFWAFPLVMGSRFARS